MKKFLVLLSLIVLLLGSCSSKLPYTDYDEHNEDEILIFLANEDKSELLPTKVAVEGSDIQSQIANVLSTLKNGRSNEGLYPTIPTHLLIESAVLDGDNLILQTNEDFEAMDQVDYILYRSSLIKSLTSISGVESIEFIVQGFPLKDSTGKVYGPLYDKDVVTASMNTSITNTETSVILYFPDMNGDSLIRVDRGITLNSLESIPQRIISELKNVPKGLDLTSVMPDESEVKSVEVNEGVCYVDFNEAFKSKHYGGATGEIMTIYALVNSLTELPTISHVQFLIEGEITDTFKGHLDFGELFEYDITLVNKRIQYTD